MSLYCWFDGTCIVLLCKWMILMLVVYTYPWFNIDNTMNHTVSFESSYNRDDWYSVYDDVASGVSSVLCWQHIKMFRIICHFALMVVMCCVLSLAHLRRLFIFLVLGCWYCSLCIWLAGLAALCCSACTRCSLACQSSGCERHSSRFGIFQSAVHGLWLHLCHVVSRWSYALRETRPTLVRVGECMVRTSSRT